MTQTIHIPRGALSLIEKLNSEGYEAYAVGGCVRDSLLGIEPHDWDICTSARPEEMQRVFQGFHTVATGLKHGTLTVVIDHQPYEVTAYRLDGEYTDHRHPDGVTFVQDLAEDLARRDFTVNAMAWHPKDGLVDHYSGREDLAAGLIRCVGEAEKRFGEDALRILRALRFASDYSFQIERKTSEAIHRLYPELRDIAAERVRSELGRLLIGAGAGRILREYTDVITFLLPVLRGTVGFDQRTPYHAFDVWEHSLRAVEEVRPTEALRMAMLLHDCGKPACFTLGADGQGHFYGHAKVSRNLAEPAAEALKMDNATKEKVLTLIEWHMAELSTDKRQLTRWLNRLGEETLFDLIEVQRADQAACLGTPESRMQADTRAGELKQALEELLAEKPCFSLRDLAVNGNDMKSLGLAGRQIGETLQQLLESVMAGELPNEREALLRSAKEKHTTGGSTRRQE